MIEVLIAVASGAAVFLFTYLFAVAPRDKRIKKLNEEIEALKKMMNIMGRDRC